MGRVLYDEISDAELVTRLARGQPRRDPSPPDVVTEAEAALRELLTRHGGSVVALARSMLGSREEAEEVLQDAFMRLNRHAADFDETRASVRTYLFAIARNLSLSRLRARKARPHAAEGVDPHSVAFQSAVGVVHDALPGIVVRDALAGLDDGERELLEGAFFQGYSHAELAAQVDQPLGTVKSRIRRALLKLRQRLEEGVA